ncbi:MAG: glutamate--cysteine ligase [Kiritimatiellae bacterium]|nr:glutamate--cysteine ligase [Kiritimatiellia bacterium]
MSPRGRLGLFEGCGVELEYMIVDRETLDVRPLADELLRDAAGRIVQEARRGRLRWSNELVLHVIELKTHGPTRSLAGLAAAFGGEIRRIHELLEPHSAMLMPTGMHPWMDPLRETRLWPHGNRAIYEAYDRIFGCAGHGWSNLQSIHLNLPFRGDEQFGRLHAAVRLVLPILPALAASTPVVEGRLTGLMDNRLEVYRRNQAKIPSVAGRVIPEPVFSRQAYRRNVLHPMYRDIAPHDSGGLLQEEWLNSRGAIARFDRHTIEIRLLDVQETPAADVAIVAAVLGTLRLLVRERWACWAEQCAWEIDPLEQIFLATLRDGDAARLDNERYLAAFGVDRAPCSAGRLWAHLIEAVLETDPEAREYRHALEHILERGVLARRLTRALADGVDRARLAAVYRDVCDCLLNGRLFTGAAETPAPAHRPAPGRRARGSEGSRRR